MSHLYQGIGQSIRGTAVHDRFRLVRKSESARDVVQHRTTRMRETIEINVNLSALKNCICEKAKADTIRLWDGRQKLLRIPIRQSFLTRILKHVFDRTDSWASEPW